MEEYYKRGELLDFSDEEGNQCVLKLIDYIEYGLCWYAVFTELGSEDITIFRVENPWDASVEFLEAEEEKAMETVYQIFLLKFPQYREK